MLKKLICLLILLPAMAFAAEFNEGKDFEVLSGTKTSQTKSKDPMITEFFSFGCPWCSKIDEPFRKWTTKLGNHVTVERVPVVFKPNWELYAKAYYTAKILALSNTLDPLLFKAIQDEKKPLNTAQAMIDFFVAQGVNKEIATSAFENSPSIDMRVKNGMMLMAQYQINAVPAFVVNNKYKTDLQMAGGPDRLFLILDYLLKRPA